VLRGEGSDWQDLWMSCRLPVPWLLAISAILLIIPVVSAQKTGVIHVTESDDRGPEAQLIALERLWNEAQVQRDASALANMIGDKFVNTEWDGEISERGKFLADIADPHFQAISMNIQDVKVRFYQSTAIVTGIYHAKGSYQSKAYDHVGRFTDTWVHQDGKWECVASHTSLLPK
jgi:ketosteroid isomerase-like protein